MTSSESVESLNILSATDSQVSRLRHRTTVISFTSKRSAVRADGVHRLGNLSRTSKRDQSVIQHTRVPHLAGFAGKALFKLDVAPLVRALLG